MLIAPPPTPSTLQQIFDRAWQKFIVEKAEPAVEDGTCRYITNDGKKCAIGLSIPDGHRVQCLGYYFGALVKVSPELWANDVKALDDERLNMFQYRLHDGLQSHGKWFYNAENMKKLYRRLAKNYNLVVPPSP